MTEQDDEWSVAMIAFNEAIDRYIAERGSFSSFASVVIGRRLTDELRRSGRHSAEISVAPDVMDGSSPGEEAGEAVSNSARAAVAGQSIDAYHAKTHSAAEEIEAVQEILRGYGFSFWDLADCSPKTAKTRAECAAAVGILLRNVPLFEKMQRTGSLPSREMIAEGAKKKILERHRRYIIAAAVILNGEYPLLAVYMDYIRKSLSP